jgi:hypothetical protein
MMPDTHTHTHTLHYTGTWRGLEVAVKRVIFQLLTGPQGDVSRRTALHEAAINAALHHCNIVATYSYDMKPLGGQQVGASCGV